MKQQMNIPYGAVQGTYWMYFASMISFASVFLLEKNYSNTEIGIILSAAGILSVIMQPLLADAADRAKKTSLAAINSYIAAGLLAATVTLFFLPSKMLILSVIYILIGAWLTSQRPLLNAMAFDLGRNGHPINFGATRAAGSMFYAILCAILGLLVSNYGVTAIPAAAIVSLLLLLLSLTLIHQFKKRTPLAGTHGDGGNEDNNKRKSIFQDDITEIVLEETEHADTTIRLKYFVTRHKAFVVFSLGIVLLFFHNSVIGSYLMQIISELGGTSTQMGHLFSFNAILELPGLIFFCKLRKRFSCQAMLRFSSVFFIVKIFLLYMATSVSFVYVAFAFQLSAYPIFLAAAIHLVDEVMEKGEAVKGQAFITGMMTLSNVFGNLAGGIILDHSGASRLLLISTVLCTIGAIVVIASVGRIKSYR